MIFANFYVAFFLFLCGQLFKAKISYFKITVRFCEFYWDLKLKNIHLSQKKKKFKMKKISTFLTRWKEIMEIKLLV